MLNGFPERLNKEMRALVPRNNIKLKIIAPPERIDSGFRGGSIMASLDSFDKKWIRKDLYDEYGCHSRIIENRRSVRYSDGGNDIPQLKGNVTSVTYVSK